MEDKDKDNEEIFPIICVSYSISKQKWIIKSHTTIDDERLMSLLTPQELGRALTAVIQYLAVAYGHSEYEIMSEIVDILMGKTEAPPPKIEHMKLTEQRDGTTDVEICPWCHREKCSPACRMLHG